MAVVVINLYGHDIDLTVAHAALGNNGIREFAHLRSRAAQQHGFKAVVMVEMHMGANYNHVMKFMLNLHQALGQIAAAVVIHIRQARHTVRRSVFLQINFR